MDTRPPSGRRDPRTVSGGTGGITVRSARAAARWISGLSMGEGVLAGCVGGDVGASVDIGRVEAVGEQGRSPDAPVGVRVSVRLANNRDPTTLRMIGSLVPSQVQ